jgi:hypothetical protein
VKSSAIIVRFHRPLRFLPPAWIEILSRILFQWIRGVDARHDRRWRRLGRYYFHTIDQHPVMQFYPVRKRSGRFHRRHMAIEERVFDNQDGFLNCDAFRDWLKTGAHFGQFEASCGQLVFVPASTSYDDCSDDEMREFHDAAMEFLRTPYALAVLWPVVRPDDRLQMLELALQPPSEDAKESP